MSLKRKPEELASAIDFKPTKKRWPDEPLDFEKLKGTYSYPGEKEALEYLEQPNPRKWQPYEDDWKLPENWKDIILEGLRLRLKKFRTLQVFMDCCVRCGACADKCHFFLGTGDPYNMPVKRAELLRAVYKKEFTKAGKIMGKMVGAEELTFEVLKKWFYYFYQCTQCRRCSVFCPYGIDTAEITFLARELMNLIGINIDWVMTPVKNSHRTGNHLGVQPHGFVDSLEFAAEDLEDVTGVKIDLPINKKGSEILFITPSADYFSEPHYYTLLGYMALFHELGLDYTFSSYASEGGNFGSFVSHDMMRVLNYKMYAEAKRLGVKWILGGECGHMWRVVHQYMDTLNGPPDFLEVPKSPITGTVFDNAKSTKMVHIMEFTADLIKNGKLKLDPSRNDHWHATFHDSCNPSRGMGLLEEPRYVINQVMNNFTEMPDNTIKEQTFCCGSGAGLGNDENFEMRMRGGLPRANAVKHVADNYGANILLCICAIDKAVFPPLLDYWVPGTEVGGIHEMVANAMIMKDEKDRTTDLRSQPFLKYRDKEEKENEENGKEDK